MSEGIMEPLETAESLLPIYEHTKGLQEGIEHGNFDAVEDNGWELQAEAAAALIGGTKGLKAVEIVNKLSGAVGGPSAGTMMRAVTDPVGLYLSRQRREEQRQNAMASSYFTQHGEFMTEGMRDIMGVQAPKGEQPHDLMHTLLKPSAGPQTGPKSFSEMLHRAAGLAGAG